MTAETVERCVMVTTQEMLASFYWHQAFSWEISFSLVGNHNQQKHSLSHQLLARISALKEQNMVML